MEKYIDFDSIGFTDDFMFQSVMMDEKICKAVLERIMQIKLRRISVLQKEKAAQGGPLARSVRFDVYCEDEDGNAFDVEMQNVNEGDLPLRARYYQAMMYSGLPEKGIKSYRELRRGVIIFLCNFNPFGGARALYHVKCSPIEGDDIPYEDGALKIFACTEGKSEGTPVEILRFLSYLKSKQTGDDLTNEIDAKVKEYRSNPSWRGNYMENHAHEWDLLDRGRKEGKADAGSAFGRLADALKADGKESLLYEAAKDARLFDELCRRYGIA